jgi:hypothetical protein
LATAVRKWQGEKDAGSFDGSMSALLPHEQEAFAAAIKRLPERELETLVILKRSCDTLSANLKKQETKQKKLGRYQYFARASVKADIEATQVALDRDSKAAKVLEEDMARKVPSGELSQMVGAINMRATVKESLDKDGGRAFRAAVLGLTQAAELGYDSFRKPGGYVEKRQKLAEVLGCEKFSVETLQRLVELKQESLVPLIGAILRAEEKSLHHLGDCGQVVEHHHLGELFRGADEGRPTLADTPYGRVLSRELLGEMLEKRVQMAERKTSMAPGSAGWDYMLCARALTVSALRNLNAGSTEFDHGKPLSTAQAEMLAGSLYSFEGGDRGLGFSRDQQNETICLLSSTDPVDFAKRAIARGHIENMTYPAPFLELVNRNQGHMLQRDLEIFVDRHGKKAVGMEWPALLQHA